MRAVVEYVQNLWPLSTFVFYNSNSDLRQSDRIVKKLAIPESTKHFVYAIREPESQAVIYVLAVQNLSERSALDAECLIREIKPDAVVVQMGQLNESEMTGLREGRSGLVGVNGGCDDTVPTSVFEVLMNCFMHKINKEKYEDVAGSLVLREIFGVSFNGHLISAKKTAEEVGSSFLMLESPFVKCNVADDVECDSEAESKGGDSGTGLHNAFSLQLSSLVPTRIGSSIESLTSRAFRVTDEVQTQMVKFLSSYMAGGNPGLRLAGGGVRQLADDYEAPQFAKCVYPLLVDLHDIFAGIPSIGTALACAQKVLCDVDKGEVVDNRLLSEVYAFQIAVEGLRIALNNAGRVIRNPVPAQCKFSDLPVDDQAHAILAQALRSQTKKYKSIVAVVDASGLAGLRKNWKTAVPPEIEDMVDQLVFNLEDDDEISMRCNRKWKLTDKPVVAVGAGATAVFGASSLSKVIPASSFIKVATLHLPTSLQKAILMAFGKGLGPTKMVASSSLKGSTIKAIASAEKIRAVAHSVIASAEKTSLSAMRSAFYEIMRNRQVRRVGLLPFATFGCSMATCAGLLVYGDGIECACESVPAAPSIASLGRGIRSLHLASQVARPAESSRIQKSIESLLHKFKNLKIKIQ
ncbi:transmembrane protein [Perilla frutescens var. frutescens]|nr:transmembrane protein [Perilla frutescens var. frutescens]